MPLKPLLAAGFFVATAALGWAAAAPGASAQTAACAEEDLRCRVTELERRLDDLTRRLERPSATGAAATPLATMFNLRRPCRTNCEAEATAACEERGYASGRAEDWERQRSGPLMLTRITCTR